MVRRPESTSWSPLMEFRNVDLPAPFEPITDTNWPDGISSDRPRSARVSIGVPGLKVRVSPCALSMSVPLGTVLGELAEHLAAHTGKHERDHH